MDDKNKNVEAAAPSRPFALGNRTLLISQATISNLASLIALIRKKQVAQTPLASLVNDPAFSKLPMACQVEAAREGAKVQASGVKPVDALGLVDAMLEPEVLAFAIWILARANHPDLTLESIKAEVNEKNAPEKLAELNDACGTETYFSIHLCWERSSHARKIALAAA